MIERRYIGSSLNSKEFRLKKHISNYKDYLRGKYHYESSFEILKHHDAEIDLIKDVLKMRKNWGKLKTILLLFMMIWTLT